MPAAATQPARIRSLAGEGDEAFALARLARLRRLVQRRYLRTELGEARRAVLRRRMRGEELRRPAALLAHFLPQRHRGLRIEAGARCELDADLVGFRLALAAVGQLDREHGSELRAAQREAGALI